MFNIVISSAQNRTGRSTCAKILSKVLDMPKTSAGDLLRLFALEYVRGIKRGELVDQFINGRSINHIFEEHVNLTSDEFVNFHTNIASIDKSFDIEIEKYVIKTFLKGGFIIDTVIGNMIIHLLQDSSSKVFDTFVSSGDFSFDDVRFIKQNSICIYFEADIDVRASRSAYYESFHGNESSVAKEKELLLDRELSNKNRYQDLYDFNLYHGANWYDFKFDTSAHNPIEICTQTIENNERMHQRAKELGIHDIRKAVETNADW